MFPRGLREIRRSRRPGGVGVKVQCGVFEAAVRTRTVRRTANCKLVVDQSVHVELSVHVE